MRLPRDRETGRPRHNIPAVYGEMLLEICRDYPGLPDPRTLSMDDIRFFFEGMRPSLKEATGAKK